MWEQIIPQLFGAIASRALQGKPKAQGIDFKKLRADAEAAGFNALTALGATGAAGYERTVSEGALSSAAFMGEAVSNGLTSWFNAKNEAPNPVPQGGQGAQVDPNRLMLQAGQLSLHGPVSRPSTRRIRIYLPDGQRGFMLASTADRLGIKPEDTLTAGDYTELVGELAGEVGNAIMFSEVHQEQLVKPIFGPAPIEVTPLPSVNHNYGGQSDWDWIRSKPWLQFMK